MGYLTITDRQAEPEPKRARIESSLIERFSSAALLAAKAKAEKAEAEEAIPASAGKLFFEITFTFNFSSDFFLTTLTMSITRSFFPAKTSLLSMNTLSFLNRLANSTVVRVKQLLRFIEIELLKGKLSPVFFLPQYLINAILAGDLAVAL